MKLLIVGALNSSNLGDPILCLCTKYILQRAFPEAELTLRDMEGTKETCDAREHPDERMDHLSAKRLEIRRWKYLFRKWMTCHAKIDMIYSREIKRYAGREAFLKQMCDGDWDGIVVAGGQMLMNRYALPLSGLIRICERKRIPVYVNACGTGPDFSKKTMRILKSSLRLPCVRYLSVRDGAEKVRSWKTGKEIEDVSDPALFADSVLRESGSGQLTGIKDRDRTRSCIGLGVIYSMRFSISRELKFWKKVIAELDRKGLPWKLFCNGSPEDMQVAEALLKAQHLSAEKDRYLMPRPQKPEDIADQILQCRGIISFRLHSHIIAASLGVPSLAIVWDDKVRTFFDKIGYPDRCFDIETSAAEIVRTCLAAMQEGVNSERILSQRERSAEKLVFAIQRDMES